MKLPFNYSTTSVVTSSASVVIPVNWVFSDSLNVSALAKHNTTGQELTAVITAVDTVAKEITVTNPFGDTVSCTIYVERRTDPVQNFNPSADQTVDTVSLGDQLNDTSKSVQELYEYIFGNTGAGSLARVISSIDAFTVPSKLARASQFIRFDVNGNFELSTGLLSPDQQAFLDELDNTPIVNLINVQSDWNEIDVDSDTYIQNKPNIFPTNWESIADKPPSFTPSAHTHPWVDIESTVAIDAVFSRLNAINSFQLGTNKNAELRPLSSVHDGDGIAVYLATAGTAENNQAFFSLKTDSFEPVTTSTMRLGKADATWLAAHIENIAVKTQAAFGDSENARIVPQTADSEFRIDLQVLGVATPSYTFSPSSLYPHDHRAKTSGLDGTNEWENVYSLKGTFKERIVLGESKNIQIAASNEGSDGTGDDSITVLLQVGSSSVEKIVLSNTGLYPFTASGLELGSEDNPWGDLYAGAADFSGSVNIPVGSATNPGLKFNNQQTGFYVNGSGHLQAAHDGAGICRFRDAGFVSFVDAELRGDVVIEGVLQEHKRAFIDVAVPTTLLSSDSGKYHYIAADSQLPPVETGLYFPLKMGPSTYEITTSPSNTVVMPDGAYADFTNSSGHEFILLIGISSSQWRAFQIEGTFNEL